MHICMKCKRDTVYVCSGITEVVSVSGIKTLIQVNDEIGRF